MQVHNIDKGSSKKKSKEQQFPMPIQMPHQRFKQENLDKVIMRKVKAWLGDSRLTF